MKKFSSPTSGTPLSNIFIFDGPVVLRPAIADSLLLSVVGKIKTKKQRKKQQERFPGCNPIS
jgi:hypothetical protein